MRKRIGFKDNKEAPPELDFPHLGTVSLETDPASEKDLQIQAAVRNLYLTIRDRTFKRYGPLCISKGVKMLKILYPDGIQPDQYLDAFILGRVMDKIVRVADGQSDADDGDGWHDIAGWAIRRVTEEETDD